MQNKTTYYRKTKSDSLLGGWKMQKVTRRAKNRKARHAQRFWTADRCWSLGFLAGTMAGSLFLHTLGNKTIHLINSASAQESAQTVLTTDPQPPELTEGEVAKTTEAGQASTATPSATPLTESELIEAAVNEFLPKYKSEALMIMHCLAHREARHGANKGHGDNGKAGGPFQFHQPTWDGYRKLMNEEPSSRYDFKEAARTTAWALSTGRSKAWGPIYRAAKGSTFATCPVPSWEK